MEPEDIIDLFAISLIAGLALSALLGIWPGV